MVMKVMWRGIGLKSSRQLLVTLLFHCHGGKGKANEDSQGEEGERARGTSKRANREMIKGWSTY
jgi:hypothetical protein